MEELRHKVAELSEHQIKLDGKVDTILSNHLPHIQAGVDRIEGTLEKVVETQHEHSKKFVQNDLSTKIIFTAVGFILIGVIGGLIRSVLK